jgi:hypothetical protein
MNKAHSVRLKISSVYTLSSEESWRCHSRIGTALISTIISPLWIPSSQRAVLFLPALGLRRLKRHPVKFAGAEAEPQLVSLQMSVSCKPSFFLDSETFMEEGILWQLSESPEEHIDYFFLLLLLPLQILNVTFVFLYLENLKFLNETLYII